MHTVLVPFTVKFPFARDGCGGTGGFAVVGTVVVGGAAVVVVGGGGGVVDAVVGGVGAVVVVGAAVVVVMGGAAEVVGTVDEFKTVGGDTVVLVVWASIATAAAKSSKQTEMNCIV